MALAVRQILVSSRNTGTSLTRTFASPVLAGSLLVALASVFNSGGNGEPTISDPVNGNWGAATTTGFAISGDADSELWLWSFPNSAAGTPAVTINPPGTSSDNDLTLFEITGALTASPRDKTVTATGTYGNADGTNSQAFTTAVTTGVLAQADEILIFAFSQTGNTTALATDTGDGFTQADENESNASGQAFNVGYKIVSATTSVVCNGTGAAVGAGTAGSNATWFTGVASFKAAVVTGPPAGSLALLGVGR